MKELNEVDKGASESVPDSETTALKGVAVRGTGRKAKRKSKRKGGRRK